MKRFVLSLLAVTVSIIGLADVAHSEILYGVASSPDELQQIEEQIKSIMEQRYSDLREITRGELAFGVCEDDRNQIVYAYGIIRSGTGVTLVGDVGATVRTVGKNRCGGVTRTMGRAFQMRADGTIAPSRY